MIKKRIDSQMIPTPVYILVMFIILSSKTVFFGIIHMKIMLFLTFIAIFMYNMHITKKMKFRINKKTLMYFITFILFLLVVSLCHFKDMLLDFNSYIGAIILFLEALAIGFLVVNTINKEDFIKAYVHILIVISLISLVYFFLLMIDKSLIYNTFNIYESGNAKYIALPWYTYGWQKILDNGYVYNYMFGRNAGPFWEPGAFQGFLFIALFMLLNYKELFKHKSIILIILITTLLTTQSTAAYIVLLISLIGFSQDYIKCLIRTEKSQKKREKKQTIVIIMSLIFIIFISYIITSSGNITNKFGETEGSYVDRKTDINTALEAIMNNLLAGIGHGKNMAVKTNGTTTILEVALYYGIIFAFYYCYRFMYGCIFLYQTNKSLKNIVLVICFTIILMSETLYLLPMYAIFLFSSKEWNVKVKEIAIE